MNDWFNKLRAFLQGAVIGLVIVFLIPPVLWVVKKWFGLFF